MGALVSADPGQHDGHVSGFCFFNNRIHGALGDMGWGCGFNTLLNSFLLLLPGSRDIQTKP